MPESIVQVTSGGGPKLHTWQRTIGANNVEDELVLPGEHYVASYVVTSGSVALATANSHLLQIMAGASLNVRIRRIYIAQASVTTSLAHFQIQLVRLTTAGTGGTGATPGKFDTADAASGATGMTLPTAKGTESTILTNYAMVVTNAATIGEMPYVYTFGDNVSKPLVIPAGTANGLAIKNVSSQAAGGVYINVEFTETSFL